ncbi:LamB/YcsF family protein [Halalkalibacterium ligniniphilum]|uniref:LamB/YcsF family protein n=1 Tax=Halalkalibacterium ligniniphilum TaxID=1134413 RepID=UPI0003467277|nr:5-oxoprolinase subunit PxpA [Halalkalibacterium ligniniphilum]
MLKVDLNCDMGESFGLYQMGNDEGMMQYITSANIACGFHAGDPHVIKRTIELCKSYDVGVGVHPGFPDLVGFGRRHMNVTPSEIQDYVIYQMGAIREFASMYNLPVQHCKLHGALFMMAMEDKKIAKAFLEVISKINPKMIVFALNQSEVAIVGKEMGIPIAYEGYADREHTDTGSIVLTRTGPSLTDVNKMAERVVRMVKERKVITYDGKEAEINVQTVCIHGDTEGAPLLAKAITEALMRNEIEVTSIKNLINQ